MKTTGTKKAAAIHPFTMPLDRILAAALQRGKTDAFLQKTVDLLCKGQAPRDCFRTAIFLPDEAGGALRCRAQSNCSRREIKKLETILGRRTSRAPRSCHFLGSGGKQAGCIIDIPPSAQTIFPPGRTALLKATARILSGRLDLLRCETALKREKAVSQSILRLEKMSFSKNHAVMEMFAKPLLKEALLLTESAFGFVGYLDPENSRQTLYIVPGGRSKNSPKNTAAWQKKHRKLLRRLFASKKSLFANTPPGSRNTIRFASAPAMLNGNIIGIVALANAAKNYSKADLHTVRRLAAVYAATLHREFIKDRLMRNEENFSSILNTARDLALTVGADGRIKYINERIRDYGYLPKNVLGRTPGDFIHPDDKVFVVKAIENAFKTGKTLPVLPYRAKRSDGSYFYAEQKNSIIFKNGRPESIIGMIRDVSLQKQLLDSLKEKDEMLSQIFDTAKDAIYVKDLSGVYRNANKACSNLMNVTPDEMIGRSDRAYFSPDLCREISYTDRQVMRRGKTITLNADYRFPLGKKYVHVIKTPLKNTAGRITGLLGITRDITKLRKIESELALAKAFESVGRETRPMAHDFNNALAAINGYATLIDEDLGPGNPIKPEIAMIIKGVWRASKIIARLQKYARNPGARHKKTSDTAAAIP